MGRRAARMAGSSPPTRPIRQRVEEAHPEQFGRDPKRERHLGERLEVHRRRLVAVEREVGGGSTDRAADGAERQRLDQDRDEHRRRVEAERAKRGDLARPRRDRGVHRQDGAKDCADTHERGDAEPDRLDQPGHRDRLRRVVRRSRGGWRR